jgi:hypothetical protein
MRKTNLIFIALLLSTMTVTLCSGVYYLIHQQYLKYSARERFENKELISIKLKTSEIRWEKKGKEFVYHDRFFDVKKQIISGDSTICIGWFDEAEDELVTTQRKLSKFGHKEKKATPLIFFGFLFMEEITSPTFESLPLSIDKKALQNLTIEKTFIYLNSPPPEVLLLLHKMNKQLPSVIAS